MMAYGKNEPSARVRQLLERPRNLALTGPLMSIIINAIFMLSAIAGVFAAAKGMHAGVALVFGAMMLSGTYTLVVRAKQSGDALPDERERVVNANAIAVSASLTSALVAMWFLLVASFAEYGMWYPDAELEWRALGFFVIGLMSQITNIATAWMTPPYAAELLDDE